LAGYGCEEEEEGEGRERSEMIYANGILASENRRIE
jgi:hypothetical protein